MASPFYLDLVDANGKHIEGDASMGGIKPPQGYEKNIVCLAFEHTVVVPTVAGGAGGMLSNAPTTDGITITKFWDKTSPILQQSTGTVVLQSASFTFWAPDPTSGTMSNYFTVAINGVTIKQIAMESGHSGANDAYQSIPEEDITFTFKSITYTAGTVQASRNA